VLSASEKNYSQIEKEGLTIIFALKQFQRYLSGRHFTLHTDHRPLIKIFGQHDAVPSTTSARLQRWAIFLGCFDYTIGYNKSADNANADGLSRHPVGEAESIDSE
ncbi:Ty3/Gypsy family RNase HI domain-containing protein, partial [Klebsiella pneumoniae]|nr:Ty3/Gypsy family RNase HI domain-containing protein [Klebsiella pneumoniae]